jgi:hypothetical protein
MKRLDLTVESIVWRHRHMFEPSVGNAAKARLREYGFDVVTGAAKAGPSRSRQ